MIPVTGLQIIPVAPALATELDVALDVGETLPPSVSLRGARVIVDQKEVPCCVSCAFASATESGKAAWPELSPLFHYFVTRTEKMGAGREQAINLTLEQGQSALEDIGICPHDLHPVTMDSSGLSAPPSDKARSDAAERRLAPISVFPPVSRIELLDDFQRLLEWKRALLTGKPIVAGIDLPVGYGREMKRAPWPAVRLGPSHAVAILGYRDSEQAFVVQDSRGPEWFQGGQWLMPYAFAQSGFVYKAYALRIH